MWKNLLKDVGRRKFPKDVGRRKSKRFSNRLCESKSILFRNLVILGSRRDIFFGTFFEKSSGGCRKLVGRGNSRKDVGRRKSRLISNLRKLWHIVYQDRYFFWDFFLKDVGVQENSGFCQEVVGRGGSSQIREILRISIQLIYKLWYIGHQGRQFFWIFF